MTKTTCGASLDEVGKRPTTLVFIGDHEQNCHASVGDVMNPPVGGHDQHEGFPWGPSNCSLLVIFTNHVALRLCEGKVRIKSCS